MSLLNLSCFKLEKIARFSSTTHVWDPGKGPKCFIQNQTQLSTRFFTGLVFSYLIYSAQNESSDRSETINQSAGGTTRRCFLFASSSLLPASWGGAGQVQAGGTGNESCFSYWTAPRKASRTEFIGCSLSISRVFWPLHCREKYLVTKPQLMSVSIIPFTSDEDGTVEHSLRWGPASQPPACRARAVTARAGR